MEWRDGLHALVIDACDIQFDDPKAKDLASFELPTTAAPPSSLEAVQTSAVPRGKVFRVREQEEKK